jgi:L-alanine-DL-glutamate epimerase-like enolase superfamily enzyme
MANLQLAAGTVGHEGSVWVEWPYDPPEWSLDRRDYCLEAPLPAVDGWITLGDEPGLGCRLDEEMLSRTTSERATFE